MDSNYYADGRQVLQQQSSSTGSSAQHVPPLVDAANLEQKKETRRRTKTGCVTCRKRRIKCDEAKPECMRCVKSKRLCEGYHAKTVFRNESQLHYQQSIRPSPMGHAAPGAHHVVGYPPMGQPIQFSVPQYQTPSHEGSSMYNDHAFAVPQQYNVNGCLPPLAAPAVKDDPTSRNSSASNASGISANSEQRRISVLSLMSSDKNSGPAEAEVTPADNYTAQNHRSLTPLRSSETEVRDNYYYNYYITCHAYTMARAMMSPRVEASSPDNPSILWPQTVPALINEDPPGRRPLFDAIVAYTAHIRFEQIPVDYDVRSVGVQAQLIELGIKAFIDIMRGTSETLSRVEAFFTNDEALRVMFRWGLLQHTIVQILADTKPRVPWINFLGTKAFASTSYTPATDTESFYLAALRHISSNVQQIPPSILELQGRFDFLSIPGMDIIYFAFIQDYDALRNIAYHILANPRLEYLHAAYKMINGGRLRGEPDLDLLANELMEAFRQCQ